MRHRGYRGPGLHLPSRAVAAVAGRERLCVEVLGPIRLLDADGRDVTPVGTLQRRLLALLVLRRGRVVSVDSAVEVLWPSELPADPVAALQNHLFRLRRAMPDGVIEAVGDGYRLDAAGIDLDADRFPSVLDAAAMADEAALSGARRPAGAVERTRLSRARRGRRRASGSGPARGAEDPRPRGEGRVPARLRRHRRSGRRPDGARGRAVTPRAAPRPADGGAGRGRPAGGRPAGVRRLPAAARRRARHRAVARRSRRSMPPCWREPARPCGSRRAACRCRRPRSSAGRRWPPT